MVGFTVYESELKRLDGRFRWNSNGFLLVEYGVDYENHFRLDLNSIDGTKRKYYGGDYKYSVSTIHLKEYLFTNRPEDEDEDSKTFWLYYYVAYQGGGVWAWSKDYVKEENTRTGSFQRHDTEKADARHGHYEITSFLADLSRVTNTTQTLGIATD